MIKVQECRYCDGTLKCWPYGKDESVHCSTCGAEWDPIEVEYPDNYFDDLEELEFNYDDEDDFYDDEEDEEAPRFLLDEDSICYGCFHYVGAEIDENGKEIDGCSVKTMCVGGNMNGYRMDD